MKNTGNYFFVKKTRLESDFTQIPNNIFKLNLTSAEKLILIYLFSNAETFRITKYRIQKDLNTDVRTVNKAMEKFKKLDYIKTIDDRNIELNIGVIVHICNSTQCTNTHSNSTPTICNPTPIDICTNTPTICNPTYKIGVEIHSNNTNNNTTDKKNEQKEKQHGENFSDFGSSVQSSDNSNDQSIWFSGDSLKTVKEFHNAFNNSNGRKKVRFQKFEKLLVYQFVNYTTKNNYIPNTKNLFNYIDVIQKNQDSFFQTYDQLIGLLKDNPSLIKEFEEGLKKIS